MKPFGNWEHDEWLFQLGQFILKPHLRPFEKGRQ